MNDQPPLVSSVNPSPSKPSKTSGLAVASLVLGILGLTCILPIIGPLLAIIFGIVALNQISKSGGQIAGQGQAIAGLITGGVSLVMIPIIILMVAIALPNLIQARERARAGQCLNNVKGISLACAMYANDNSGKLPRNFDDLKEVLTSTRIFICPSAKDQTHYSYAFTGVTNRFQEDMDIVILREIEENHFEKRTLLFNDGHVEQRKD